MQFTLKSEMSVTNNSLHRWSGIATYNLDGEQVIIRECDAFDEDTAVLNGMEELLEECARVAEKSGTNATYRGSRAMRTYRKAQASYIEWSGMMPNLHLELA